MRVGGRVEGEGCGYGGEVKGLSGGVVEEGES